MITLRKFQREFIRRATSPEIDTACLSLPRGNGKSTLAGYLASRILTPSDPLFRAGSESVVLAASLEQGRIVYRAARDMLADSSDYRFADSFTRVQITHKATKTALQVRGSNPKTVMGLNNCPYVLADEPGSWLTTGGSQMFDVIQSSMGKPDSPLTAVYLGTLAPASGGWWPELVERGNSRSTYVQVLQGDLATWDSWHTIRRANPLVNVSPEFRKKLLEERDAARADTRLKARFLSYRLNIPTGDESTMLVTVAEWKDAMRRPIGLPIGAPIVAIDLGGGRAWSAAVAIWRSGMVDAIALAPGIPSISDQERRDRVPSGTYQRLVDAGVLRVSPGLQVQPVGQLWEAIGDKWGRPVRVVCDRFRLSELQDAVQGRALIETRVTRWSEAAADVRALRRLVKDGPLSVAPGAAALITTSLAVSKVVSDDQGSVRLAKDVKNNVARDDVAAALLLAAGAFDRAGSSVPRPARARVI